MEVTPLVELPLECPSVEFYEYCSVPRPHNVQVPLPPAPPPPPPPAPPAPPLVLHEPPFVFNLRPDVRSACNPSDIPSLPDPIIPSHDTLNSGFGRPTIDTFQLNNDFQSSLIMMAMMEEMVRQEEERKNKEAEEQRAEDRRQYEGRHDKMLQGFKEHLQDHHRRMEEKYENLKAAQQPPSVHGMEMDVDFRTQLNNLKSGLKSQFRKINLEAILNINRFTMSWFASTDHRQSVMNGMCELQGLGEQFHDATFDGLNSPEDVRDLTKAALSESLDSLSRAAEATESSGFEEFIESFQSVKSAAKSLLNLATRYGPGISVGRDLYEAFSGKDAFSGEELSAGSRVFSVLSAAVSGGLASAVVKSLTGLGRLARHSLARAKFPGAGDTVRSAEEFAESVAGGAQNRAAFETLVRNFRELMQRPHVQNPELNRMLHKQYRGTAELGSGSTAAAIRYELETGRLVKGRSHIQKGQNDSVFLRRWLQNNPNAAPGDRAAAENVLRDLQDVLRGI